MKLQSLNIITEVDYNCLQTFEIVVPFFRMTLVLGNLENFDFINSFISVL